MELPLFSRNAGCTACPLHETCKTVCVGSVAFDPTAPLLPRAILVVGEAPGAQEDDTGVPFVGRSGQLLRRAYIKAVGLHEHANVFIANSVRCRPPGNATPSKSQVKACHPFLLQDICRLQDRYAEVVILCAGGTATQTVLKQNLTYALGHQGVETNFPLWLHKPKKKGVPHTETWADPSWLGVQIEMPKPCRVFSTYHPAFLGRNKSAALTVYRHLTHLREYLSGGLVTQEKVSADLQYETNAPPPKPHPALLSLDIETYGILKGQNQRYFHPQQSIAYDKITPDNLVVSAAISYHDVEGRERHVYFPFSRGGRQALIRWLDACHRQSTPVTLLGQNLVFDLMYLRASHPMFNALLRESDKLQLADLMITSTMYDEQMPEKGLKALSRLWNVDPYDDREGGFVQYESDADPALAEYNCRDTRNTLLLQGKFEEAIRELYKGGTAKLTPLSHKWYSDLLWLVLHMTEAGLRIDPAYLLRMHTRKQHRLTQIENHVASLGYPLKGKGSQAAKQRLIQEALDWVSTNKPQFLENAAEVLELTEKEKRLSFKDTNRNLLSGQIPRGHPIKTMLRWVDIHTEVMGTVTRYTRPLNEGRTYKKKLSRSGSVLGQFLYPRWYPVPTQYDGDAGKGGTIQSRMVAKTPGVQTFPPLLQTIYVSRYNPGFLLTIDYSQIEMIMAGLLSNDEEMLREFALGLDRHRETAKLLFGDEIVSHVAFRKLYRQAAKTLNFLVLFLGGAQKFRRTLIQDLGLVLELRWIQGQLDKYWAKYKGLKAWHDHLLATAIEKNYIEIPLIGASRMFLGNKSQVRESINEIVNVPVQGSAANVTLSSMMELRQDFKRQALPCCIPMNTYDSIKIDGHIDCLPQVMAAVRRVIPNPWYYDALCQSLGRRAKLETSSEISFFGCDPQNLPCIRGVKVV